MEDMKETLDKPMKAVESENKVPVVPDTEPPATSATNDFAQQFAQWLENPLVAIALADSRLCRFIGDLLSGEDSDSAAHRNFPQHPAPMPADVASKHGMNEAEAHTVAEYGRMVMAADWSDNAVEILLKAARHDADVKNAEADGYLRGRNTAIKEKLRHRSIPLTL